MVLLRNLLISFLLFIGLTSCLSRYNNFDVEGNTQVIVPLAHGSFVLGSILNNFNKDSIFQYGSENELIISYKEDGIERLYISDLISIPRSLILAQGTKTLDEISLEDTTYYKLISLGELVEKLAGNKDVPDFIAGEKVIFPEINLGKEVSMFLTWKIADIGFIKKVTFKDGEIQCSITNNFPTTCNMQVMLFDSAGNIIDLMSFNGDSGNGMLPGQTQVETKNLGGLTIKPPLYFNISSLNFSESTDSLVIDMERGFDMSITLHSMKIKDGNIRSDHLKYVSSPQQINVDLADSAELKKVLFETATMDITFLKYFNPSGSLSLNFPGLKKNGIPVSFNIPVTGNDPISNNYNLEGTELTLANSITDFNSLEYYFEFKSVVENFVDVNSSDRFEYYIDLQNLTFSYIEGYFGKRKIDISKTNLYLNQEIWEKYHGEIMGNDAKLTLYFNNPFGIPINSTMGIEAFNQKGDSVGFSYPNFALPYPENKTDKSVLSEINFTDENSKIDDLINLPPNGPLNINATIELNPNGRPLSNKLNFVNTHDPFEISIGLTVPVLIKGFLFNYIDTLVLPNLNILDRIKKAELIFRTINNVPLQVKLTVVPYDTVTHTKLGDDLFVNILDAAKTDDIGNAISPTETENKLILEEKDLNNLKKSNRLIINAAFISPENGTKPAKLKNDDGFDIKIILNVSPSL
jgi:hypothetical protein